MNENGGAPGPGLFARLAQRASGAKAELEPRLGARYAPAALGARDAGLEAVEAEVVASDGAERPRAAGPGLPAAEQATLAPPPPSPPAVGELESAPVRRSAEREEETEADAPVERWSAGTFQQDAPAADTGLVSVAPARPGPTDRPAPATSESPAAGRPRPVGEPSAADRAFAAEIVTPRRPPTVADAPARLDVELDADDDGIPWSLLTGPIGAAAQRHDPRDGKEDDRPESGERRLEPVNDGRAGLGAARSSSPALKAAEPAAEPDEIHVHIGRIEVAAPSAAAPRAARARRAPRITLNDYLGLGSPRGGRR